MFNDYNKMKYIIINKYERTLAYYFMLLLGLTAISWIIYARFLRERVPKDIPMLLTEPRFWLLVYLCCIYIYIVKSLIKPPKVNESLVLIIDAIFKPLIILDHLIKYNVIDIIIKRLKRLKYYQLKIIYTSCQLIPRIILVTFLLADTFYFHKLEILYKIILLGLILLIHRYLKYCLKDIKKHYIETLEEIYERVYMWDEAYSDPTTDWELTESNKYHKQDIPIKEYGRV